MRFPHTRIAFLLACATAAPAQQYVISTYAGKPPVPDLRTSINAGPVTADAAGNVYVVGVSNACTCVFRLDGNGTITRVAGTSGRGFAGDGGPATGAQLSGPTGLAVDSEGDLFIVDEATVHYGGYPPASSGDRVRKVSASGIITTIAGGGTLSGSDADGKPATSAQLYYPVGAAVDSAGNLYFSEGLDVDGGGSNRVRKVSPDGTLSTVAGNGNYGFSGDGGPAVDAALSGPSNLAVDSAGNLFLVDGSQRIRRVSPDGTISTVVDATASLSPACYCSVTGVAVDNSGSLIYVDASQNQVRRLKSDGTIATVVPDAGPWVWSVAVDETGSLFVSGASGLRKIAADGLITVLTGASACCYSGDGGPAVRAQFNHPQGVAADPSGNLFVADTDNHRIRRVSRDGTITAIAGTGVGSVNCAAVSGDSASATAAQLCSPSQLATDASGDLYIVDGNRIGKLSADGNITLLAGNGTVGQDGEGIPATQAQLAHPNSVAADAAGNVWFAEWARVRKISPDGTITTVAGDGTRAANLSSPAPDGGPATSAQLSGPTSVTVDPAGNVYFIDGLRIRKVSPDGILTTVAGNGNFTGYRGYTGDGGAATSAPLWLPNGIAVDATGRVFISEPVRIRMVTTDGIISTIAGDGEPGYAGDGGPARAARFWNPTSLSVDPAGNVFVLDSFNDVIRVLW